MSPIFCSCADPADSANAPSVPLSAPPALASFVNYSRKVCSSPSPACSSDFSSPRSASPLCLLSFLRALLFLAANPFPSMRAFFSSPSLPHSSPPCSLVLSLRSAFLSSTSRTLSHKVPSAPEFPPTRPLLLPAESASAEFLMTSPGFFQAMSSSLLSGRDFEPRDSFAASPVAIVNHAFVDRYFPGQKVLGKQLSVCWTVKKPVEIVGIVAAARQADPHYSPSPPIFLPTSPP